MSSRKAPFPRSVGRDGSLTRSEVADLARELSARIEGEVRFGDGDRAIYSTDASNYRQLPIGVVVPRTVEDVVETVAVCREAGAPIVNRGGGTSLAGQCCNVAVVIDFSKHLNRVLDVDRDRRLARVEPGAVLDTLRLAAERGDPPLTFAPDPSTHAVCTLGGMIGNNACGVRSVMGEFHGPGPRTSDNVHELEVLTYDGLRVRVGATGEDEVERIVAGGGRRGDIHARLRDLRDRHADRIRARYPRIPRRVSGYNLDDLLPENGSHVARALAGTEGTCVTVLEATVHLVPSPPRRSVVLLGFRDLPTAADHVPAVREHRPTGLEGFDAGLLEANRRLGLHAAELDRMPEGNAWLLVELGGETEQEARGRAEGLVRAMRRAPGYLSSEIVERRDRALRLWEARESGLGASAFVPGESTRWAGWEDAAVHPERVGDYLRAFRRLLDEHGYRPAALYGHLGQGCVHCRIDFDLTTAEGLRRYRGFLEEAADLVLAHGGSLSGEHGDGQARAELLPRMFGPELVEAFREFKAIWDPEGRMNPGKVVDPAPATANLRLGTGYAPKPVEARFGYPEDGGSFARAALRCVGVGKCRRPDGGTMCPSYMVTREEKHSTRGRARILFEMMNGAEIDPWRSDEVREALDLCLACKACKGECPVHVDMATYKAEFLSHHYEGRLRPRSAYAMGLVPVWARVGAVAPGVANTLTHAPGISRAVKWAGGIAPEREVPRLATRTFRTWFRRRRPRNPGGPKVLLWPDTFTDVFRPEVGRAHVDVLEAAGYRVVLPDAWLCCGRPLYDQGMLGLARRLLERTLRALRHEIAEGTPIVAMEPSCLAVFRDELPNLLRGREDARRLAERSSMLSELLDSTGWRPPARAEGAAVPGGRPALVHLHCHQRAVIGFGAEERVLGALGVRYQILDSGCCGMAGGFGFERGAKYDVAMKAGERVLLPAVRQAAPDTLVVTNGFSCGTQIQQGTGRRPLHLAEVVAGAVRDASRS